MLFCSTTAPVERDITDLLTLNLYGAVRRDGQCCGRTAQCGQRSKRNWTKIVHRIRG